MNPKSLMNPKKKRRAQMMDRRTVKKRRRMTRSIVSSRVRSKVKRMLEVLKKAVNAV